MEKLLKEFFFSDVCEANLFRILPTETANAMKEHTALEAFLKERLNGEYRENFDKYIDAGETINDEDRYLAFICGIKTTLTVLGEIYCGEL